MILRLIELAYALSHRWWLWQLRARGLRYGRGLSLSGLPVTTYAHRIRLGERVKLGKDVVLGAWPAGNLSIGNDTYLGSWTVVLAHERVEIGNDCLISPGCHITDVNHGIAPGALIRAQPLRARPVRIGNDVWIGAGCSILPGVQIGDGAVIGARAAVTHDVPAYAIAAGVPARVLRSRTDSAPKGGRPRC